MAKEKQNIEILRGLANDDIKAVLSDLFFLSVHPVLHQMLDNNNSIIRQKLADDFKIFCSNSTRYDQIRFLDETGMETIRINFNNANSSIAPDDELQNKASRYYFADAFALDPGRIFVSPFDLNMEHGQIEQPLKPMIRIGTPVVDLFGRKRGIVLLNYFGERLINNLKMALPDYIDSFMLLNNKGYWLKGLAIEDEWGFMYKDRKDLTLAKRYPEIWKRISANKEGQFTTHQGIYTYTTVWPLNHSMLSSSISDETSQSSTSILSAENYYWKIVSVLTKEKLKHIRTAIFFSWLPYFGVFFLSIILVSVAVSLALTHRKQAVEERFKREKLQGVLEMAGAICHELNQPLMAISGYSELVLMELPEDTSQIENIKRLKEQVDRLGIITKKLMNITQYKTKSYLKGNIVDINAASNNKAGDNKSY